MTDHQTTAEIVTLRKRPQTQAERAKAYRARKRACQGTSADKTGQVRTAAPVTPRQCRDNVVTPRHTVTSAHHALAPWLLNAAAIGLAGVGITMNGWFARSLGSSDIAGWLFLAIGVAADASALALPSCAAARWRTHQRGAAAIGWLVYLATFLFALTAGIGFASVNISDVTASRASRVTPAVTQAQAALSDAQGARDRECKGGVGKVCREREAQVVAARGELERAMHQVEQASDPQVEASIGMVAWVSHGWLQPSSHDFAMLRLVLLALLPQLGGILLMVGRGKH